MSATGCIGPSARLAIYRPDPFDPGLLAGCATTSEIPESLRYTKTTAEIPDAAFIKGSNRKDAFPLFDDHTACVMAIDGRSIKDERKRWAEQIPLQPGRRKIEVLYYHGVFITGTEFSLEAAPGSRYEVRCKEDGRKSVDFWIVDLATGEPVTGVSRGLMSGGGGGGFVPIFIPVK